MRWLGIVLLMLAGVSAFGAQPRVNGVEVVPATNGHARNLTVSGLALSNINGTASSSIASNVLLTTNVSVWVFTSGTGTNFTLTLPTNTVVADGLVFKIVLGAEGTNFLNIIPTSAVALATADKIHRSTNFVITPGMSITIQQVGTNWNIIDGFPETPIGGYSSYHKNFAGVCGRPSSFWVECNGQVLADPGSPLNGNTIPNYNAEVFDRYNATSGGTGGAADHFHPISQNITQLSDIGSGSGGTFAFTANPTVTDGASTGLPPYIDSVRLIRVK